MEQAYETFEHEGYTIEIWPDGNVENPLKEDEGTLGEWCIFHRRYDIGNSERTATCQEDVTRHTEELQAHCEKTGSILLPVYMYDHSGVVLSLESFHGRLPQGHAEFDSFQCGWVLIDRDKTKKLLCARAFNEVIKKKARENIEGELTVLNQWLSGDVWGYVIKDKDGEQVDSCWNYYGLDTVRDEAKASVNGEIEYQKQEAEKRQPSLPFKE